jgi:hypothetical protein
MKVGMTRLRKESVTTGETVSKLQVTFLLQKWHFIGEIMLVHLKAKWTFSL